MLLRKRAEEILLLAERTKEEIALSGRTVSGDLYIGSGETDGVRQLAEVAKRLREKHPGIRFHIVSGDAMDVCEQLDKGLLDFGVLLGDMDQTKYSRMELPGKDRWGVLMRRDSPLAEHESILPADLWDRPLILSRQTDNKAELYRWLGRSPAQLHTVATYNLIYNASRMVEEGLGYALALDKLINTAGSALCFRPLQPELEVGMYLVWKKTRSFSQAAALFFDEMSDSLSAARAKTEGT